MLASINPLGERGRNQRYPVTAAAYVSASTVAGATLGGVLGAMGASVDRRLAIASAAVVSVAGLAFDARLFGRRVPGPRRQVDERWLDRYRGWVYGAGFGAQLGLGFTTIVSASATWAAFACALFSGSSVGGIAIGTTFGLVRALPVLATARTRTPERLYALVRTLDHVRPVAARATVVVQLALAALLVGVR